MATRVVAGVDGSHGSVLALRWALEEAHLRGATLEVVHVWHYPYVVEVAGMAPYAVAQEELERAAHVVLDQTIQAARPIPPELHVESLVAKGDAAVTLIERAKGADLLVIGSRGRGGFVGLLLGSVGQQCTHHAPCPVVIVPDVED